MARTLRPHGIAVDPKSGHVLVTTEKPNALLVVDPSARKVLKAIDVKGIAPHMVTIGADSQWAFTSNSTSGDLSAIHLSTGAVRVIAAGKCP